MMAFAVEDYSLTNAYNPKFFRWLLTVQQKKGGNSSGMRYPLHPCIDLEFEKFYEAEDQATANKMTKF